MLPDVLNVKVGEVVAVKPPSDKVYLAQVLYVEAEARPADPNFLQVCRLTPNPSRKTSAGGADSESSQ